MAEKPISAKVTKVDTRKTGKMFVEDLIVQFADGPKLREEPFASPILSTENLQMWRQTVLSVCLLETVEAGDKRTIKQEDYKDAIVGQSVYIAFGEGVVYGIGKDAGRMFFPDAYGLFDIAGMD